MKPNLSEQKSKKTFSVSLNRLNSLAERASKINQGALKECVAVPSSSGGYIMEIREIKNR